MARGLSHAMAARTRPSDSAGSQARNARARSACIAERGADDLLLRQVAAIQVGDDAAVAKDVDAVAVLELVGLGGVPEEGAAARRFLAKKVVDLEPRADVHPAHR